MINKSKLCYNGDLLKVNGVSLDKKDEDLILHKNAEKILNLGD